MAESKYAKYVKKELGRNQPMPARPVTEVRAVSMSPELLKGIAELENVNLNFNFMGVVAPHMLGDPPHKHDCDELLFFIASEGTDSPDLGGEVEFALGDDWEKHTITTSCIVSLPAGVQHCPVYVKKVTKPFYFGHILLAGKYGSNATPAT